MISNLLQSRHIDPNGFILFTTRITRLFAYGFLSIVLVLYLSALGMSEWEIGLLLTLILVGDTVISLWITTNADRIGRKRMLIAGAALMIFAGLLFAFTQNFIFLLVAGAIGVISPSGNEVGPFLALEQAALSQIVTDKQRTHVFAWYNLVGSFATALGALCGGGLAQVLQGNGMIPLNSYRVVVIGYALIGLALGLMFMRLSARVEAPAGIRAPVTRLGLGLHRSRKVVIHLSSLFVMDAFAGGLVLQSFVAYWFHVRYGVEPGVLGGIFFGANILAGISALSAVRIAGRIGLINTMVFTHVPSNILLILVPLMPTLPLAILVLLLRFSISQMDVPTRQSYTMAVVEPNERSAAAGVTGIARTLGSAVAPSITGQLMASAPLLSAPFILAGTIKIIYDLLLYRSFQALKPPEEVVGAK
ncbi:MAG: MFS transporter [Chloroflexi bacterium]|nr:MFS transporter [Chloroflexota bacterium]MCL5275982.1 MFS transporter [Chloroflexota bacterium]